MSQVDRVVDGLCEPEGTNAIIQPNSKNKYFYLKMPHVSLV